MRRAAGACHVTATPYRKMPCEARSGPEIAHYERELRVRPICRNPAAVATVWLCSADSEWAGQDSNLRPTDYESRENPSRTVQTRPVRPKRQVRDSCLHRVKTTWRLR